MSISGRSGALAAASLAIAILSRARPINSARLPRQPPFLGTRGGSSTRAIDREDVARKRRLVVDGVDEFQGCRVNATLVSDDSSLSGLGSGAVDDDTALTADQSDSDGSGRDDDSRAALPEGKSSSDESMLFVKKRDNSLDPLSEEKILQRLHNLSSGLNLEYLSLPELTSVIMRGTYPNITTLEIDTLASETAASRSTQHPDYAQLAARICATSNHKHTPAKFSEAMIELHDNGRGFVSGQLAELVERRGDEIDEQIRPERDLDLSYFGYKTLERAYLLKDDSEVVRERPSYMWMRVALGIHMTRPEIDEPDDSGLGTSKWTKEEEDAHLEAAFETYHLMSKGYCTHASPTLFHAGTTHPQLSSCFLVQMSDDSINGIYDTLKRCAVISKAAGGIGLSVNKIRARGTFIKGTRGVSNGLVPMLRVFDSTSHYVDQGGGKRPGAFAIYVEPWHADIFDVLNLRKNHGKEEQRARNLFYGLWVPDLFMKRVEEDGVWSLMCPHECPGLAECHGEKFKELYEKYESEGRYKRQIRARQLWAAILDAQIETGNPYILYKDAANGKSNQQNLGTIQSSNLCTEIIQYTNEEEVAVCNLASINLSKFVVTDRGVYGSTSKPGEAYFDHGRLHEVAKTVTRNLDKVIDINQYPIEGAKLSNRRHRPVGIGVSGLADAFLRLGLPFSSDDAKQLNEAIFETIYHAALEASNEIAVETESYSSFEGSPTSRGELQFNLWGMKDGDTPSHRGKQDGAAQSMKHQRYPDEVARNGYDWDGLRQRIIKTGLRNSLLVAPMPTASTSQILGVNECFEPFATNLYVRRVKAGEFIVVNPHLIQDLTDKGLWNKSVRNQLMRDSGSVANIDCIPDRLKELYRTVWEMKMRDLIDMAADRGRFIDQSQSLNLFTAAPTVSRLTAMHFYAWRKGLKTGIYYLRTKPAVNAIQFTVSKSVENESKDGEEQMQNSNLPELGGDSECLSCSA